MKYKGDGGWGPIRLKKMVRLAANTLFKSRERSELLWGKRRGSTGDYRTKRSEAIEDSIERGKQTGAKGR